MLAVLRDPRTGDVKRLKLGWSWALFLYSGIFGLGLFSRRLYLWGFLFLALSVVQFFTWGTLPELVLSCATLTLAIWLGAKGNEMTARHYVERGWVFEHPESPATKAAMALLGIGAGGTMPAVRRPRAGEATKTCPDCDEAVARDVELCPVCRYDFAEERREA